MSPNEPVDTLPALAYWREAASLTARSLHEAFTTRLMPNVASGVTVALVALPLNMALAIACGLPASVGLVTGAIAGLLGALLGGSRLQITGPEVALAPITLEIITRHGLDGLLVVTMMAGLFQIALGSLRIGRLVHAIPVPVIGGFLAAVGIMVFDSQLPVFLGISSEARLVTDLTPSALDGISRSAVLIGAVVIALMVGLPRVDRRAPAPLVALVVAMAMIPVLGMSVPMVAPIESGWPVPALPSLGTLPLAELVPEALALGLIASIDSLLCAVSVDARTAGPRTRTDQELVAQGLANIGSACFGGMPVAAAVVRSAAAVEAGATSRLAPLVQSVILALVVVAFSSFVGHIPLVALASILLVIGWRLIDWTQLRHMWRSARFEVAVFVATSAGILLTDFVLGVVIGVMVALAYFAHRQRELVQTRQLVLSADELAQPLPPSLQGVRVIRLEGPLFFASQIKLDALLERADHPGPVVIDLDAVPTLDCSGAIALARASERLVRAGSDVWLCSLTREATTLLEPALATIERLHLSHDLGDALRSIARRSEAQDSSLAPASDHSDGRWRRLIASTEVEEPSLARS